MDSDETEKRSIFNQATLLGTRAGCFPQPVNGVLSALISCVINQAGSGQLPTPVTASRLSLSKLTCRQTEIRQSPGYVELNNSSQIGGFFAGQALHNKLKPLTSEQSGSSLGATQMMLSSWGTSVVFFFLGGGQIQGCIDGQKNGMRRKQQLRIKEDKRIERRGRGRKNK